jgi:hypothetical protein
MAATILVFSVPYKERAIGVPYLKQEEEIIGMYVPLQQIGTHYFKRKENCTVRLQTGNTFPSAPLNSGRSENERKICV